MRLLGSIIGVAISDVDGLGRCLPISDSIATQFIRHDLPGFAAIAGQ